jgi:hypothetical protein
MTTYRVHEKQLKLDNGDRRLPGETVASDEITDREEDVHTTTGVLQPADDADEDEPETEVTVEHDIPPEAEADDADEDEPDWRNDYHDARSKASELRLDSQGTHEELVQRIETELEETDG